MWLLPLKGVRGSHNLTCAFTGAPFFSEPYDEKLDPLSPIPSTPASAIILPATLAPRPPILSKRISYIPSLCFLGMITLPVLTVLISFLLINYYHNVFYYYKLVCCDFQQIFYEIFYEIILI